MQRTHAAKTEPDSLVRDYLYLLKTIPDRKPIIDVACGDGHNGLHRLFFWGRSCLQISPQAPYSLYQKIRRTRGMLIYETFTAEQASFGRPKNPAHLLKPGELRDWFGDWDIYHFLRGLLLIHRRRSAGSSAEGLQ